MILEIQEDPKETIFKLTQKIIDQIYEKKRIWAENIK